MKRYTVETAVEGTTKYFYIMDGETLDIALLPSKYLKHKIKANLSPNTVKRYAFSICCYLEYLAEKGLDFQTVCGMGYARSLPFPRSMMNCCLLLGNSQPSMAR